MMNPEMMRVAKEQMSRMSPSALAAMQQQIMLNPNLIKLATDTISTLSPDDIRRAADQLNQTRPDEMLDMAKKLAASTPDEFASTPDVVTNSKSLKNQGNGLFKTGKYTEAAAKYRLAVDNFKSVPSKDAQNLQKTCSVNLMACYLKMGMFGECVAEGCEVLGYDPSNVKAYYRRGQAYKEMGNLEAAMSDLRKAHELSPDEETIGEVLKDVEEKLAVKLLRGVVIEEIVEEEEEAGEEKHEDSEVSSSETSASQPSLEASPLPSSPVETSVAEMQDAMMKSMKSPAIQGLFTITSMMKRMDPKVNAEKATRWMNRAQGAAEAARNAKNFLLGRKGLVIAIVLLILAFVLYWLGRSIYYQHVQSDGMDIPLLGTDEAKATTKSMPLEPLPCINHPPPPKTNPQRNRRIVKIISTDRVSRRQKEHGAGVADPEEGHEADGPACPAEVERAG
uniref:Uncharacterized protein n=1 Tax=Leersia perrieri TaxID=77586 RepID=A0A0D9W577_9ORYZ